MIEPSQIWWTAAEIAEAGLPGLPGSQQGVQKRAKSDNWRGQPDFARRRAGRGGGWEYHWKLLPLQARKRLLAEAGAIETTTAPRDRDEVWTWYEALPTTVKTKAEARLRVLQAVEALAVTGVLRHVAVSEVARSEGVGARTIWSWIQAVNGIDPADWLAHLAPRHRISGAGPRKSEIDERFYDEFKSFYLRFEGPTFTHAYDDAKDVAQAQGWPVCHIRTLRRRLSDDIPRTMQVLAREGLKAFERCFAPQIRGKSHFEAMDWVNADWHKFDVFVEWPGLEKPVRVQVCAFQDVMSGKILSWKVDLAPNSVATIAAFGAMVEQFGIPRHCLFDNGMEFAAKNLTGGAKTRRRFKIKEDDPDGILKLMGVEIHWAMVAHGQAKPVERAFGDWAQRIAKDPRLAGAYVGNKPDAKPENYASKAIPLDEFLEVMEQGIVLHNARKGRRSPTAKGRSLDETFDASYRVATIQKATKEQRSLWLMAHQVCKLDKLNGRLTLLGNKYWSEWMSEHAGQDVVARFDPADVHTTEIVIYTKAGERLGTTKCEDARGFDCLAAANEHSAAKKRRKRAAKAGLEAANPVRLGDAAARLGDARRGNSAAPIPESNVVEGKFATRDKARGARTKPTAPPPVIDPAQEADAAAKVAEFKARKAKKTPDPATENDQYARYNWAMGLEARLTQGQPVGDEEQARLRLYQSGPEYRAMQRLQKSASQDKGSAG